MSEPPAAAIVRAVRPRMVGVVNITEDSFSDGGVSWLPRRRWHMLGGCDPKGPTSSSLARRPATLTLRESALTRNGGGWPRSWSL